MLASEANLVASVRAPWGERARNAAAAILGRIAAEEEARSLREVRAVLHAVSPQRLGEIAQRLGARLPFGAGGEDGVVTLHCPKKAVFPLVEELTRAGADDITVRALDYVFRRTNPLIERLQARI
jgi:ATP phosphoribosyltransferase